MKCSFKLLLFLTLISFTSKAQTNQSLLLDVGSNAPSLYLSEYIKGKTVLQFEKGKIYVLEFWATWCGPCVAAMPHLSILADKYKKQVTFIAVDVLEQKTTSVKKIRSFVDSMGNRMNFHVAIQDSNYMFAYWMDASGEMEQGLPRTFIVNPDGKLAWVGHPKDIDPVLEKIVNNTWDMKEELATRNFNRYLARLDNKVNDILQPLEEKPVRADSALLIINEMLKKEPKLRLTPFTVSNTFSALLETDMDSAYKYGKQILAAVKNSDFPYHIIWSSIDSYTGKLPLTGEVYRLGAEVYQARLDSDPGRPVPNFYFKMAEWYWLSNDKSKALHAAQKALETLKMEKYIYPGYMEKFEARVKEYEQKQ